MFGAGGVTGVNIYSLFVAVIGAVIVLVVYHAVARRDSMRVCLVGGLYSVSGANVCQIKPHRLETR
jgi:Transglycosylase associated protein